MRFYRKVKFRLNSSCHVKIKFWKFLVWILRAQKNASFLFFIFFLLGRYSRHFCQRSYGKPPVFITNIKSSHNFPHFHKDLRSRNFGQWNSAPLKKMKKLRFLAADFEKCKKGKKNEFFEFVKYGQKYFDSERLWYRKLSLLKVPTVELAISFQQFLQCFRSQIFVKKYEIMRTFDIRYKNG